MALSGHGWVVRDATVEDAAACAAVYAPYVTGTAISFEEVPPTAEQMAERIATAQSRYAYLVLARAQDPSTVVGYAYGGPFAARPAYRWSAEASVYVAADARGGGAGRALYEVLVARLRARGYRRLMAGITVPNEASIGLHRAFGFTQVAVYPKVGWKLDAWRDVAWLMLDLVPQDDDPPTEPGV